MKRFAQFCLITMFVLGMTQISQASYKGSPKRKSSGTSKSSSGGYGKVKKYQSPAKHDTKGYSTSTLKAPVSTNGQFVHGYIVDRLDSKGTFQVTDEKTGKARSLKPVKVYENVDKIGGTLYFTTALFKDVKTGEKLELDFDTKVKYGKRRITRVNIRKVNNKARYTYDAKGKRVPAE